MIDDDPTYRVEELGQAIKGALIESFPPMVWVRGEISQFRIPNGRHAYFDLVEKTKTGSQPSAKLGVVLWERKRVALQKILADSDLELNEGIEVRIRVRIDFYPPHGKLQLSMEDIDPVFNVGKLAADRARVIAALQEEGLLDKQSLLTIPMVPLRIGLVTSNDSAAYHDFIAGIKGSGYAFSVALANTSVQGADAPAQIVAALGVAAQTNPDVIAVVRGGGSKTDLAAFDTEVVARAIAALAIPVFTGVGHEIDHSVADEVAHTAFKTPTAVASRLVEMVGDFAADISRIGERILASAQGVCIDANADLADAVRRISRGVPQSLLREQQSLDEYQRRVLDSVRRGIKDSGLRIGNLGDRLRALDPRRVLERGYSITRTEDGRVVRLLADAPLGALVVTEVVDGEVRSRVEADQK